jgi:hypothetical protein
MIVPSRPGLVPERSRPRRMLDDSWGWMSQPAADLIPAGIEIDHRIYYIGERSAPGERRIKHMSAFPWTTLITAGAPVVASLSTPGQFWI